MDSEDQEFLNPDPETAWLETTTIGGFRVWHIIFFCVAILLSIMIMICCCVRFRIPRTKQEIEADFQRKQITKKFREKLQKIKNSEMDDMDLQKAIARIQADLLSAPNSTESLEKEQKQQLQQQQQQQPPQATFNPKFKGNAQIPA